MKKFLSLVMALALTLSLVTISAGATDFTDDSSITYGEAVDVISAIGVVDGYTNGSFNPSATLTRGAAAKIICNLILGPTTAGSLGANAAPFKDVPADHVFAGYIAYCANQGIINGYADGTFRPAGTVTGYQFMKMLLGALGYDGSVEGFTGSNWTVNVAKLAGSIGLDDGNDSFLGSQAMTREEACLYAYNTLKATMVEYDTTGTTIVVGDTTISSGASKASDVANNATTETIKNDNYMQFAEKYFPDLKLTSDTDAFERPADTWKYKTTKIGTYAEDADATYTEAVKIGTIYNDLGLSSGIGKANTTVYVNGSTAQDSSAWTDLNIVKGDTTNKIGGNGALTQVYYDDDDNTVIITVINTYVGEITSTYSATSSRDAYVNFDAKTGVGSTFETNSSYSVDDYVLYTYSYKSGDTGVQSMEAAKSVTGTLTAYTAGSSVTVAGTKYSSNCAADSQATITSALSNAVKTDVTVYLDSYGYAAYVDADAASGNYAVVLGYDNVTTLDNNRAKLLFTDGTVKTVYLTSGHTFSTDANSTDINQYDIVTYSVNSDGNYTLTKKADTVSVTASGATPLVTKGSSDLGKTGTAAGANLDANGYAATNRTQATYANGKTIFLIKNGDTYSVYTGIANVPSVTLADTKSTNVTAFVKSPSSDTQPVGAATVVFIVKTADTTVTSTSKDATFILGDTTTGSSYDSDLGTYYTYDAIVNGTITTINTSDQVSKYSLVTNLSYDSKDVATFTGSTYVNSAHTSDAGDTGLGYGTGTTKASNDVIGLNGSYYSYSSDCKVFVIGTDDSITQSSVSAIATDTNDLVWFKITSGDVTTIVIQTVDAGTTGSVSDTYSASVVLNSSALDLQVTSSSTSNVSFTYTVYATNTTSGYTFTAGSGSGTATGSTTTTVSGVVPTTNSNIVYYAVVSIGGETLTTSSVIGG